MKLISLSLLASSAAASAIPAPKSQPAPGSVPHHCRFEYHQLFSTPSKEGVSPNPIFDGYCGLNWHNMDAVRSITAQPLIPNDKAYAVATANDGSSSIRTPASCTTGITPRSFYVGLYADTPSGVSLAVKGSILVTPHSSFGALYPASVLCPFTTTGAASAADLSKEVSVGTKVSDISSDKLKNCLVDGKVTEQYIGDLGEVLYGEYGIGAAAMVECKMPKSWNGVDELSFKVAEATLPDLKGMKGVAGVEVGKVHAAIDSFRYRQ